MILKISQTDKKRLLFYADQTISESLHWGNGAIIIPDEQILYDAIKETKGKLTLNSFQLKLLLNWIFDATGEGKFLLGEDISIINKIISEIKKYHNKLKNRRSKYIVQLTDIELELELVEKILDKLNYIFPKTEKKQSDYHTEDMSLLEEKIKKVAEERGGIEEYKKELINKLRKERYETKPEEKVKEEKELKEGKEETAFEEKVKRAKVLKEEREKVEKTMKDVKKKIKGKRLF